MESTCGWYSTWATEPGDGKLDLQPKRSAMVHAMTASRVCNDDTGNNPIVPKVCLRTLRTLGPLLERSFKEAP